MFRQKLFGIMGENYPSLACPCRIEKSHPRDRTLTRDSTTLELVKIPIPRARYLYPTWTPMVYFNNLFAASSSKEMAF